MASKKERNQVKAQKILDKCMPYEKWIEVKERTEDEKKLYKDTLQTLENIIEGKEEVYDTVTITTKNGKTTTKFS